MNSFYFQGIYITEVADHSPAALSGLKQHDKILQCNGYDFTLVSAMRGVSAQWLMILIQEERSNNVHHNVFINFIILFIVYSNFR